MEYAKVWLYGLSFMWQRHFSTRWEWDQTRISNRGFPTAFKSSDVTNLWEALYFCVNAQHRHRSPVSSALCWSTLTLHPHARQARTEGLTTSSHKPCTVLHLGDGTLYLYWTTMMFEYTATLKPGLDFMRRLTQHVNMSLFNELPLAFLTSSPWFHSLRASHF